MYLRAKLNNKTSRESQNSTLKSIFYDNSIKKLGSKEGVKKHLN